MPHRQFGVAVIGSGRMGLRRAGLAAVHPAVNFIAVSDVDRSRARGLPKKWVRISIPTTTSKRCRGPKFTP